MTVTRRKAAATVVLVAEAVATILLGASARGYPGGTWCDRSVQGHAFFGNFLCDLTWEVSLSGVPNQTGAALGRAGMLALVLAALAFFWLAASEISARPALSRAVRGLGSLSVAGTIAVTYVSSERFGDLHAAAVAVAGASGLAATVLATVGLARTERRPRLGAWLGALTLALAAADLALYAWHFTQRADCAPALPALQKVALAAALAWFTLIAARALRGSR